MAYKPEPKPLATLEAEKRDVMNRIVNGAHLDFLAMAKLTRHLADLNQKIQSIKDQSNETIKQ